MVWEFFSNRKWINFDAGLDVLGDFVEEAQTQLPLDSAAGTAVLDLMHLNAAEASLPAGLREGGPRDPFRLDVSRSATFEAIFESDCGPFVGHDPRNEPRLWDVTLYGSDASKLAWLAETESVEELRHDFTGTVTRLGDLYDQFQESRRTFDLAADSTFWVPTAFAVRATLWRAKIAVLLSEDEPDDSLTEVATTLASRY
jgi:hypothetical protein